MPLGIQAGAAKDELRWVVRDEDRGSAPNGERLFAALGEGGQVTMALMDMSWGSYFGTLVDRFGVQWMFNCPEPAKK